MNWAAANEQKEGAILRVFYMLAALFVLNIRASRDSRCALAFPLEGAPLPAEMREPSSRSPAELHQTALRLLDAATLAARLLYALMRDIFELMKLADVLTRWRRGCGVPLDQCSSPGNHLDSS